MDRVKKKAELVDIILSWQIEDILNENLLKDKVKEIPTRFSSISHYLESFHYPLVEETRAELCSCLVAIASAPYVGIHFKEENDVWELQYGSELGFYCSVSGSEKRLYVPVIGDMILFSTSVPANVSELTSGLSVSCLAVVSDAGKGATGYVKARLGVPWSIGTKCIGSSFVAVFLMNVTNASHVWYSLQVDTGDSCANLNLIKKALCYENLVEKACSCSFMLVEDFFDETLRLKLHCLELNESQVGTIHSVICAIRCNHSCTIQEICGLPGTGKTEVVCLISLIAMRLKCKVLVCAPNLCSLMEIVSRFRKFVGESSNISTAHGISRCNLTEFVAFVGKNKEQVNFTGDITDINLKQACLIFCTASTLSRLHLLGQSSYLDVLVVDRAAQIKECESVVSLQLKGLRHVLLVGNDYELPSAVVSKISESAGFGRSLFRRLGFLRPPKRLLDIQYRMHPSISYFPNVKFFNGQLLNGQNVMDKSYEKQYLLEHIYGSYSFLNVADGREVPGENGDNWQNFVEAAVICKILMKINQACASSCQRPSVGILSPYDAQVQAIQDMVSSRIERKSDFSLWMKAFHKIESSEEDVIIISMVRCNENGYVGIPSDPHLTSNILTRARKCLWIVGNELTLARGPSIWKDLVLDAKERGCFFQVGEDRQLAGVILNIKQELNQLDDLLKDDTALFKKTKWKILFSDNFKKSFISLRTLLCKQLVIGFLLKLANGWRPKRTYPYPLCPSLSKIVKLYRVHGLYVICTTDTIKRSKFIQVLRVWDVLALVDIPKLMDELENMVSLCTDRYIELCSNEKHEGDLVVPMTWKISSDFVKYKESSYSQDYSSLSGGLHRIKNLKFSESLLLMKFYSLSSGNAKYMLTACDGKEIELPFELSELESEVIRFPRSAFVVGRSGTGKTIVSVMKLIRREQHHVIASDGFSSPVDEPYCFMSYENLAAPKTSALRQIFLTVNANLCSSVKDYITRLRRLVTGDEIQGDLNEIKMQELIRSKEVDFERFYTLYWPSFNMKFTTKLDPALVFTQIISYIKGGRGLGKTYHHEKMDENDYIMLSEMRSSTLSKDEREMIYKIFLDYEKRKQMNGDYDISDLVIDLHCRFRVDGYKGAMVDFVYVDEVQDFTLNQISLLKYICANVQDGYLFCGDTAQTLMKGVSFRFQEIRSMFYREFLGESGKLSDLFQLTQNFCTHAGILNLGQSILELLYHFFPLCIDRLIVERSPIYGETPAIIESANEDILGTMFETGGIGSNCLLTFGAEQVILVRDDLTKREVIDQIGNNAVVLTIFESKGLEFKDVLIYNFFKGSPLKQQWRVIYEFMDGQGLLDASLTKFPCFNENKHITLCSELKLLYVAITRTRNRLWIFESMPELAKPLFDYWKTRNLVQQRKWGLSFISSMQILCKPEEWKIRGQKFFNEGNYQAAILCFKHSGDVYLENWAKAASFQMDGDRKLHTDFQTALNLLSKASEIYEMIGKFESSAICFMKLGYYEKAARIYLEKCQEPMYEDAGDCFMLASCWSDAALCYAQGQCLSKCMTSCRKG
ncbi:PREDICTED: uncharacterized protein LOC104589404 isoform X2 [Nelumbo nucifera]|uniref:Uncharacterized protein LOC104589404 isoform X2 n=1 Tax=Nelumbo nucifera TaxID=4432 RepID=A0A1U7Z1T5_NELNU|nr:PREDICTED: uncharacterized protein LOC104589404 isoform X2 [Nelumbo nucifera]